MELDLAHVGEQDSFSFQNEFQIPIETGEMVTCGVTVNGTIVKRGSRLIVDARASCALQVKCSRCLAGFEMPLETECSLVFHRDERGALPDGIYEDDFIQLSEATENRYDIFPRVREAIILELPIRFLCREDCKGLCPTCGANLNDGDCGCRTETGDPRWDQLRNLLNRKKDC